MADKLFHLFQLKKFGIIREEKQFFQKQLKYWCYLYYGSIIIKRIMVYDKNMQLCSLFRCKCNIKKPRI